MELAHDDGIEVEHLGQPAVMLMMVLIVVVLIVVMMVVMLVRVHALTVGTPCSYRILSCL
ncbi:MAG TPA: hypothetical protein VL738_16720 [Dactylosporangium sp.]|nr:hypothetical protein [Dactylosporangium sp.]